jgi:CheY-like chemotaxis protein
MSQRQPAQSPQRPGPGQVDARHGRLNSLGMTSKQLETILQRLDGNGGGRQDRRRKFVRWTFRQPSLDLHIIQPGGSANTCRVACRNLSCGGMSVVHNAFIYPGSPCIAYLPRQDGGFNAVPGVIARCTHVTGMVHEVGIRFNNTISAGDYVENDPMAGQFSLEVVEPEALSGTLLCIEDSQLDQKLIQHYLRGTSIRVRMADSAAQAAEGAREGCDIVLCSFTVGDQSAEAIIPAVREVLPKVPVIIVTADSSPQTTERIRRMPVSAFLAKPFTDAMLQRALGEFLIARTDRQGGGSARASRPAQNSGAASDLADLQRKLEGSLGENDPTACYVLCQQLGATAAGMNLPSLSSLAQEASASLAATMNIAQSERKVREVIAACGQRAAA